MQRESGSIDEDWRAFEQLRQFLIARISRDCRDNDAAEDVIARVLERAIVSGAWRVKGRGYWVRACQNELRNYCRGEKRHNHVIHHRSASTHSPTVHDDVAAEKLKLRWVLGVLDLPKRTREAYLIVEVAGSSIDAAAVQMGISRKAVEMRLAAARHELHNLLAPSEQVSPRSGHTSTWLHELEW
jgi:DNA-directed RNA polymerase specialized sigma24 family protein